MREFGTADPKVDVVILDMVLPGVGPCIFRVMRKVDPEVPVIVLSGYVGTDPAALAELQANDRVDMLPKPYELAELYRVGGVALNGSWKPEPWSSPDDQRL